MFRQIKYLFVLFALANLISCSYSFSGASVPSHLKTINILIFADRSGSSEFNLGDRLTKQLIQRFVNDNTLQVSDKANSNSILDGTVTSFTDAPLVVSGGENVTKRRVTLTVRVIFKDSVKKTTVFEKNFSYFGDYPVLGDITTVRKQAIDLAIEKIAEDILLGVVSNW